MHWPALALLAVLLTPGCVTSDTMPTFVLGFTLTNEGDTTLRFSEYPHCATARVGDEAITVDAPRPNGRALVVVDPALGPPTAGDPGFGVMGTGAKAFGLDPEARIPDGVDGTDADIVVLRYEDGQLFVDGVPRDLPFNGTAVRPGLWRAEFTIEEGPRTVRVDHRARSCA